MLLGNTLSLRSPIGGTYVLHNLHFHPFPMQCCPYNDTPDGKEANWFPTGEDFFLILPHPAKAQP